MQCIVIEILEKEWRELKDVYYQPAERNLTCYSSLDISGRIIEVPDDDNTLHRFIMVKTSCQQSMNAGHWWISLKMPRWIPVLWRKYLNRWCHHHDNAVFSCDVYQLAQNFITGNRSPSIIMNKTEYKKE